MYPQRIHNLIEEIDEPIGDYGICKLEKALGCLLQKVTYKLSFQVKKG